MPKPRLPAGAKPAKAKARPKFVKPKKWVPTVVESRLRFAQASWPEQRRRYKQFLATVFTAGRTGRIEVSEYEDALLQSIAKILDLSSTAGRVGKQGLMSQDEKISLREVYKRLELLGVKLPDLGFR